MRAVTTTAKEDVIEMLRRLPDDATLEDIEYHVSVMVGIEKGLRAIDEGQTVTQAEVELMMGRWS